jgi:hypothetical protein
MVNVPPNIVGHLTIIVFLIITWVEILHFLTTLFNLFSTFSDLAIVWHVSRTHQLWMQIQGEFFFLHFPEATKLQTKPSSFSLYFSSNVKSRKGLSFWIFLSEPLLHICVRNDRVVLIRTYTYLILILGIMANVPIYWRSANHRSNQYFSWNIIG